MERSWWRAWESHAVRELASRQTRSDERTESLVEELSVEPGEEPESEREPVVAGVEA